mgnify:FL=1
MTTKSPFPGMDPYLEQFWGDVHASLIVYIRDHINEQLPSDLQARVEEGLMVDTEDYSRRIYPDVDVVVQLQPLLDECYRRGRYGSLDYTRVLDPPPGTDDQNWSEELLGNQRKH